MTGPDPAVRDAVRAHLVEQVERARAVTPGRMGAARYWPAVVAFVLVAAVLLGGGAAGLALLAARHDRAVPARTVTATPAPTRTAAPDALTAENDIVGTGTFTGHVRGTFRITYHDGINFLHLEATSFGPAVARDVQVAESSAAVGCGDGSATYMSSIAAVRSQDVGMTTGDDSPYRDLSAWPVLAILPAEGAKQECDRSTYTIATIHWHVPTVIAHLADHDRGSTAAARGPVELRDGRPVRYTVVSNDQIRWVAGRFGVTPADLLWLNPDLGDAAYLQVGEQLNLDPADRLSGTR